MATPNEKLADALQALKTLQDGGRRIFKSDEFSRLHRERLTRSGFLQEVIRGWQMSTGPQSQDGDTTRGTLHFGSSASYITTTALDGNGVRIISDMAGDFAQMLGHGMGVAPRHDQCGGLTKLWTNCTEDVGRPCTLIMRRCRPCSTFGPAARDLVLLADPSLILEPDFYSFSSGCSGGNVCHCGGEAFLKSTIAWGS